MHSSSYDIQPASSKYHNKLYPLIRLQPSFTSLTFWVQPQFLVTISVFWESNKMDCSVHQRSDTHQKEDELIKQDKGPINVLISMKICSSQQRWSQGQKCQGQGQGHDHRGQGQDQGLWFRGQDQGQGLSFKAKAKADNCRPRGQGHGLEDSISASQWHLAANGNILRNTAAAAVAKTSTNYEINVVIRWLISYCFNQYVPS